MSVEVLSTWLLGIMITTISPGRSRFPREAIESEADGRARYAAIAHAIADVALDPAEAPVFDGPRARERTAALLLSLSYHESGWRRDVDLGLGARERASRYRCVMQVAVRDRTPEGWTGADLVASRDHCFRAALHLLQRARGACPKSGGAHAWLRIYTSGQCTHGGRAADVRYATFRDWVAKHPLSD